MDGISDHFVHTYGHDQASVTTSSTDAFICECAYTKPDEAHYLRS